MLIIEGADRLGKTTAIQSMRKELKLWNPPILYSHMSRPNEDEFDFYLDYVPLISTYTIQDRFHLGGIVWHKDKITIGHLQRIETWLELVGSVIVVFYASDFRWYENWIKADDRSNMLSVDLMLEANQQYYSMAKGTHPLCPMVDFSYDIKTKTMNEPCFPTEVIMIRWITEWYSRLKFVEKENGIFETFR